MLTVKVASPKMILYSIARDRLNGEKPSFANTMPRWRADLELLNLGHCSIERVIVLKRIRLRVELRSSS